MLQLLDFQLSVTPEQLVAVLLDAQSGRLMMQILAAYSNCCGVSAPAGCMSLVTAGAVALPGYGGVQLPCWEGPGSAVHGQHILQQQQIVQQLSVGAVQRKRRSNSLEVMEGMDACRPKVFCGRASMEVVAA